MQKETLVSHSERSHALLSASGAGRWMNCTPSAKLEEQYGERRTSAYAEEGTLAHELGELYLAKDALEAIDDSQFESRLEELMQSDLFNDEMLDMVPVYTTYCHQQLVSAKASNPLAVMEIEQRLDLTEYVPESFGTADCVIINDDTMEVIDLKYGKGVAVSAEWNKQLMLYGLGALRKYDAMYDIKEIRLTIVQPRLDSISSWTISVDDLLHWANTELKPKAEKAYIGEGELNAGDWCRFCAVRNRCRKLYEQQLEIAKYEFSEPSLLTDDEISDIISRTPKLVEWANSIVEYATNKAYSENKAWPGYKLVEGVSRRKWANEKEAPDVILSRIEELSEEDIYSMKLKSITDMEKVVGKKLFNELLSDLVVKPQGKPTLVPLDDKRPAIGYGQAKLDFQ